MSTAIKAAVPSTVRLRPQPEIDLELPLAVDEAPSVVAAPAPVA